MINSKLRPKMSIAPIINAIKNPGRDPIAKTIVKDLGPLSKKIVTKWDSMPMKRKINQFYIKEPQPWLQHSQGRLDVKSQIISFATAYSTARKHLIEERKKMIIAEYNRYISKSPQKYNPSAGFTKDRVLAAEFQRYIATKFGTNGCRCEKPGEGIPTTTPISKNGVATLKLKCFDQCEIGHDEVFLIGVAVDGNGNYIQTVSDKYSIDDDSDDILYPHHWIYPMQNANGFLDIAIRMMEDDGGYDEISSAFKTIGGVVSNIGTLAASPYVLGAGIALEIVGVIVDIIGDFDKDDDYGVQTKTWGSASTLQAGYGPYVLAYTGEDWFGDSYDFDLTIGLGIS